jgi:hypothetical protein
MTAGNLDDGAVRNQFRVGFCTGSSGIIRPDCLLRDAPSWLRTGEHSQFRSPIWLASDLAGRQASGTAVALAFASGPRSESWWLRHAIGGPLEGPFGPVESGESHSFRQMLHIQTHPTTSAQFCTVAACCFAAAANAFSSRSISGPAAQ